MSITHQTGEYHHLRILAIQSDHLSDLGAAGAQIASLNAPKAPLGIGHGRVGGQEGEEEREEVERANARGLEFERAAGVPRAQTRWCGRQRRDGTTFSRKGLSNCPQKMFRTLPCVHGQQTIGAILGGFFGSTPSSAEVPQGPSGQARWRSCLHKSKCCSMIVRA